MTMPANTPAGSPPENGQTSDALFDADVRFEDLGLSEAVLAGVRKLGFEYPTTIQRHLIPLALKGRDVLGQSKTGSGKTAAFGLPLLEKIDPNTPFQAMVLVPTRELALQVTRELRELAGETGVRVLPVYGGQPIRTQAEKLKKNPSLLVGTPGRVMDMHRRGHFSYDNIRFAVLDEVDRMLDIGFREDIQKILRAMPKQRQTIFVSATISPEIERLTRQFLNDPEKLELSASRSLTVEQVTQRHFNVEPWDKKRLLVHLLKKEEAALTLVFCRTKHTVDGLTDYLKRKKIEAHAIHGDMYQGKRNRIMQQLREGDLKVLVASDLAARGLDVERISHVINYDIPEDPDLYVHRIGRTARAGRGGIAWTFVTPDQGALLTAIEKYTNTEIPKQEYDDFQPGPVPDDVLAERQRSAEQRERARERASRAPAATPVEAVPEDKRNELFPGGAVPKSPPARRLGGRLRTRRR